MRKMSEHSMRAANGGFYRMTCPKCVGYTTRNVGSYLWHYFWCRG